MKISIMKEVFSSLCFAFSHFIIFHIRFLHLLLIDSLVCSSSCVTLSLSTSKPSFVLLLFVDVICMCAYILSTFASSLDSTLLVFLFLLRFNWKELFLISNLASCGGCCLFFLRFVLKGYFTSAYLNYVE